MPPAAPAHGGYLIVDGGKGDLIDARGYGAVTVEDYGPGASVLGGGHGVDQTVLESTGGLDFRAATGNVTVVAGGGNNIISFDA